MVECTHAQTSLSNRGAYHDIEWVVPLSKAVVEPHVQSCSLHAGREIPHKVSLGTKFNTVPVPVVRTLEVAPPLVVLGGQNNI